MKTLLFVDHFDSFSNNIVAILREQGMKVHLVQSRDVTRDLEDEFAAVVLSPGPGHPCEYANSVALCRRLLQKNLPTLGVCLGHQLLLYSDGAVVKVQQQFPVHGRRVQLSKAMHFRMLQPETFDGKFVLYNSLEVASGDSVFGGDGKWMICAQRDGSVLAVEHKVLPILGVQFHPESFASLQGGALLQSFCRFVVNFHEKQSS